MAITLGELAVLLTANNAKFNADVKESESLLGSLDATAKKAALAAGAVFVAGAAVSGKLIDAASDAAEQMNVLNIAFGENTQSVVEWSQITSQAIGRSATDLKDYAGQIGALVSPTLGVNRATTDMSTNLAQLAIDLGSVFNAAETDTLMALKAGLIGSTEPMQRFGVNMNVAALQAFALEKGIEGSFTKMSEAEKIALRYAFVMEKTAAFQGDAARTALGWANMTKRVEGQLTDLTAQIGAGLLPHAEKLVTAVANIIGWFQQLSPATLEYIGLAIGATTAIAGVVTVVATLGIALPVLASGFVAAATAMAPVAIFAGVLALKLAVLVTAVALVRKAWVDDLGGMRSVTISFAKSVVGAWDAMTGAMVAAWRGASKFVVDTFNSVVSGVGRLFDTFSDTALRALDVINPAAAMTIRGLKGMGSAAKLLVPDFEGIGDAAADVGDAISDAFSGAAQEAGFAFEGLKGAASETADFVLDAFSELGGDLAGVLGLEGLASLFELPTGDAAFAAVGLPTVAAQGKGKGKGSAATAVATAGAELEQSLMDTGQGLINSLGNIGDLINTTVQAGQAGGPYAAAAAALASLATKTMAFGEIVGDLDGIFNLLVGVVEPVISVVRSALQPLFDVLRTALRGLAVVVGGLSIAVGWVVNAIIDFAAGVLDVIAGIADLVGGGGEVRRFARQLRSNRVDLGELQEGMRAATEGADELAGAFSDGATGIMDAAQLAIQAWLGSSGVGRFFAEADRLATGVVDSQESLIEQTDATSESIRELNESISNVPTGFRVAAARFSAIDVGGEGLSDTSVGGNNVTIIANDAREVYDRMREFDREGLVIGGQSPTLTTPNAVDRRGS
jgi:hypothetical protein